MRKFKIQSDYGMDTEGEPLYWDNQFGWTDLYNGTEFSEDELDKINLPMCTRYLRWKDDKTGEYIFDEDHLETPEDAYRRLGI